MKKQLRDMSISSFFTKQQVNDTEIQQMRTMYQFLAQEDTLNIFSRNFIESLDEYIEIIKNPLNLSDIKTNINNNTYNTIDSFYSNINRMFSNHLMFFQENSDEYHYTLNLQHKFERKYLQKSADIYAIQDDSKEEEHYQEDSKEEAHYQDDSKKEEHYQDEETVRDELQHETDNEECSDVHIIEDNGEDENTEQQNRNENLEYESDVSPDYENIDVENQPISDIDNENEVNDDDDDHKYDKSFSKLKKINMSIDSFFPESGKEQAPKKYLQPNIYLTRIAPNQMNARTFKNLEKVEALGFCTTTSNGKHTSYRCSAALFINGRMYQCTVIKRFSDIEIIKSHTEHEFEIDESRQTKLQFKRSNYIPVKSITEKKILDDISYLVACESVPLNRVTGNFIYDLIINSIQLGQKNPQIPPNQLFPNFSKTTIRSQIINLASSMKTNIENHYKSFSHVAMVVDAGTVNSFHFLDACIIVPAISKQQQPANFINPYNYDTYLINDDTVDNIQNTIVEAIHELHLKGIKITSITSDNYPNQVIAFAPWSKKSFLRSEHFDDPIIKRIFHCPCASHTLNLIAKSIGTRESPLFLKTIYDTFMQAANVLCQFEEAGLEKPPKIIKTRWLLILNILIYIRSHDIFFIGCSNAEYPLKQTKSFLLDDKEIYNDILGIDFTTNPKYNQPHKRFKKIAKAKKINLNLFSRYYFKQYMYLGKLLWPLFQAILFFERNESSMVSIYTIFNQINEYWNDFKHDISLKEQELGKEVVDGWNEAIDFLQEQLIFREFHTFDWPIISLAYIFTPAGRMFYQAMLKNHGFTVYHDEILSDKNPSNFDFILYVNDDFTKISIDHEDEIISEQMLENEQFDANSDQDELHLYFNENDIHTNAPEIETNESNSLNDLNLWFFPSNMMKKEKSILFINVPWKEFNENHSINGKKLRYHNRPMTDIEFQYEPMNPALIEVTLHEALERLQYNESDIQNATLAFKHWCTTPIGIDGLNISEFYDYKNIRNVWEKIKSFFTGKEKNDLSHGYIVLSDLALTFISCSSSETQCERYISKQKLGLCKSTRNINKDLLDSIWFLYSHREDIKKFDE